MTRRSIHTAYLIGLPIAVAIQTLDNRMGSE